MNKESTRETYKTWFLLFQDFFGCEAHYTLEWDEIELEDQMEAFKNHILNWVVGKTLIIFLTVQSFLQLLFLSK